MLEGAIEKIMVDYRCGLIRVQRWAHCVLCVELREVKLLTSE